MSTSYTPNPALTPATSTLPTDGDALGSGVIAQAVKDALNLAANARLNAAKTNVDNGFSSVQSLNGGRAQQTANPLVLTRTLIDTFGNAANGHALIRSYISNTDTFEVVINGAWSEGTGAFVRDVTGTPTLKYVFSSYGLQVFYYSGAAASVVDGSDWQKTMDFSFPASGGKGKVFGGISDVIFGLSQGLRETPQVVGSGGVPFASSDWSDLGISGERKTGFWKDAFGVVHLEGMPQKSTGTAVASTIFTLPAGYRPSERVNFQASINQASATIDIYIQTDGQVVANPGTPATIVRAVCLEGLTFRAG